MASQNFEKEKQVFRKHYDSKLKLFRKANQTFMGLISALLKDLNIAEVTKIEGRIKDKEECIRKFQRKYLNKLEVNETRYEIKDYITDIMGIRIICLYEDQIEIVSELLKQHFKVIEVTDKISAIEKSEDSFGYKGFHMDLALNDQMSSVPEHKKYSAIPFEVQIRSIIQDAWSVLDHHIKYKKSIPNALKRRINILSALFELADREFKEVRNATMELIEEASTDPVIDATDNKQVKTNKGKTVNAFNFLRVVGHFFKDFEFEDFKVDDFVQDILKLDHGFKKSDLHLSLHDNIKRVRDYADYFLAEIPDKSFSPYTSVRHCLYLYNPITFNQILSKVAKDRFDNWLKKTENE